MKLSWTLSFCCCRKRKKTRKNKNKTDLKHSISYHLSWNSQLDIGNSIYIIDHFRIALQFSRSINWSRGFVPRFHTFAEFSRMKPRLQVIVRGNWSVIRIYLPICVYLVLLICILIYMELSYNSAYEAMRMYITH